MSKKYLMVKYHGIDSAMYTCKKEEDIEGLVSVKLFYSRASATWSDNVKGKRAAGVVDTGNEILVSIGKDQLYVLDYHDAELLRILLKEVDNCNMKIKTLKESA